MGSAVLVSAIQEEARVRLDLPAFSTTSFVTTAAALNLVKYGVRRLSALVRRANSEYFTTVGTIPTEDGTNTVALPSDFSDLRQLSWLRSANDSVPLEMAGVDEWLAAGENAQAWQSPPTYRIMGETIRLFPCPLGIYTLSIFYDTGIYVTAASDTIYCQPGWDEWLILDFCVKVRQKEQDDATDFLMERASIEADIVRQAGSRDRFRTHEVRDLYSGGDWVDSRSLYVRR